MQPEIQILIDYVEGKIDINEFRNCFERNLRLQMILKEKFDLNYVAYKKYNNNLYCYLTENYDFKNINWDVVETRYSLYIELCRWLDWFKIPYKKDYTKYIDDYDFLLDIQPSWLDISDDQGLFDKVISEIPNSLSKTKRIQLGKAKIKELFRYDKTYPRWVQDPEWPIIDGVPLVFSHQSKEKKDDERVYYYFYHPKTKKQVVVEQIY